MQQSAYKPFKVNSGSSKVVHFGTNRKCVYDFMLVINSNLGPILHRFRNTAVYWSKNRQNCQFVPSPVSEVALARGDSWNFVMNQIFLETRMFRLSDGEEIMTLAFFVLIQYRSVTDGHLCSGYTSACIACYANALVKTTVSIHTGLCRRCCEEQKRRTPA